MARYSMCILDNLLIQVYKRSGTTHRFVAVVLQILIVFVTLTCDQACVSFFSARKAARARWWVVGGRDKKPFLLPLAFHCCFSRPAYAE